ncbi:hypothetical protein BKA65DRAFT_580381 [Rhexocercosporidium sp. MPI-PUGE-AT-0058]|nr:hypothetical protein BKA65DRAFT_580381 [Rhexocercosporidium sp. MPI-PUGE-AT-0058]
MGDELKTFGGTDPGSVWKPPVPKGQKYMQMDQFVPNEEHMWWDEHAERCTPKVVPQVMLRLCENQCYKEERRPEMFGKVWFPNQMTTPSLTLFTFGLPGCSLMN